MERSKAGSYIRWVNFFWPGAMIRTRLLTTVLVLTLALAPGLAMARAGGGFSFGSRGGMTFSAPRGTPTAPYAAPMQRSLTPNSAPQPGFAARPAFGGGYGQRSPFASGLMGGLMGGLVGAGIGGLLFGHGMFGGIDGIGSIFGLLIQLALLFFVGRWILRRVFAGGLPAMAGSAPAAGGRGFGSASPRPASPGQAVAPRAQPITISPADYHAFDALLTDVQAAWSGHDLTRLRVIATPEMVSYFAEQMAEQASRGVRNLVTAVHLDRGDLSEAWREASREYATVAMRFSMLDVTRDGAGRVVDGSDTERQTVTEVWTFVRVPGGAWLLSAIQQAR